MPVATFLGFTFTLVFAALFTLAACLFTGGITCSITAFGSVPVATLFGIAFTLVFATVFAFAACLFTGCIGSGVACVGTFCRRLRATAGRRNQPGRSRGRDLV